MRVLVAHAHTRPPCTPRVLLLSEGCDSSTQLHSATSGMRSSPYTQVSAAWGTALASSEMGAHTLMATKQPCERKD